MKENSVPLSVPVAADNPIREFSDTELVSATADYSSVIGKGGLVLCSRGHTVEL